MASQVDDKARFLMERLRYMAISTTSKRGEPWAAAVFFAHDQDYNLYFISAVDSQHSKNIMENPKVAAVIYDSNTPIDSYDEVQLSGTATLMKKDGLAKAIDVYCRKLAIHGGIAMNERYEPSSYLEPSEFRFFKVSIKHAFATDEELDRRVEVNLRSDK